MNEEYYNFNKIITPLKTLAGTEDTVSLPINIKNNCLNEIKDGLDEFFMDFKCEEVLYTINTDTPMFGIFIKPIWFNPDDIVKLYTADIYIDEKKVFEKYSVEIDSKLSAILSPDEVCSLLIHDLNELLSCDSIFVIRSLIDSIIAYSNTAIDIQHIASSALLFKMIIELTLHNITSVLVKDPNTVQGANEFIKGYGLGDSFISALVELSRHKNMGAEALMMLKPTFLLNWYFMIYKNAKLNQTVSSDIMKSISIEGSTLVKRSMRRALDNLIIVSDVDSAYINSITESATKHKKGLVYQMKRGGLKSLEEDLYEYEMRLRNVDTQEEAILLMRQINSRISILDDYINDADSDKTDNDRWKDVYEQYRKIRSELSRKTVYDKKMYGLFIDYNALADMSSKEQRQILQSYY